MAEDGVNPIWKYVAMTSIGIIVGLVPGYVSLNIDQHTAVTRKDVDDEIMMQNAPIATALSDLKEQVKELVDEVHTMNKAP